MSSATVSALQRLCSWASTVRFEDLPRRVVERACLVLADTVGVALAGARELPAGRLRESMLAGGLVGRQEPGYGALATVLAPGLPRAPVEDAVFLNATAAGFLELDEGSRPTGHPALHVAPAVLGWSEALGAGGPELLTALVVGHEVQARIQWAVTFRPEVHPHGNMGVVAAALGLARLFKWDPRSMLAAAGAAGAFALATTWDQCLAGADVRNAWAGLAGRLAATAIRLVEAGFASAPEALETVFGRVLGSDWKPEALDRDLGRHWYILDDYFKFHAACALTHPVLDALGDALGAEHRSGVYPPFTPARLIRPDQIRKVRVGVPERNLRLAVKPVARDLSVKFSIPYAVAAYLVFGSATPRSFQGARLSDPSVQGLMDRVEVVADPDLIGKWPGEHGAWVELYLSDGRVLRGRCQNPYGSPTNEPDTADLRAKFQTLAREALPEPAVRLLWDRFTALPEITDVRLVFDEARRIITSAQEGP